MVLLVEGQGGLRSFAVAECGTSPSQQGASRLLTFDVSFTIRKLWGMPYFRQFTS